MHLTVLVLFIYGYWAYWKHFQTYFMYVLYFSPCFKCWDPKPFTIVYFQVWACIFPFHWPWHCAYCTVAYILNRISQKEIGIHSPSPFPVFRRENRKKEGYGGRIRKGNGMRKNKEKRICKLQVVSSGVWHRNWVKCRQTCCQVNSGCESSLHEKAWQTEHGYSQLQHSIPGLIFRNHLNLNLDKPLCKYWSVYLWYITWGVASGHQASPVFTIILSFWNLSDTLLVQPISMIKAASACKFEGLQADVYHVYTKYLLPSKTDSWILSHTLLI